MLHCSTRAARSRARVQVLTGPCGKPCSNGLRSCAVRTRKALERKRRTAGWDATWKFASPPWTRFEFLLPGARSARTIPVALAPMASRQTGTHIQTGYPAWTRLELVGASALGLRTGTFREDAPQQRADCNFPCSAQRQVFGLKCKHGLGASRIC